MQKIKITESFLAVAQTDTDILENNKKEDIKDRINLSCKFLDTG